MEDLLILMLKIVLYVFLDWNNHFDILWEKKSNLTNFVNRGFLKFELDLLLIAIL